jgi:hypothetical protein
MRGGLLNGQQAIRQFMTKPNFFIIGAPKCGTTSLYTYLAEHPNVFMPEWKEPHYFASDLRKASHAGTYEKYMALFTEADPIKHRAVGEASVHYIHSAVAVPAVYDFNPQARIIAMLRNPMDMLHSYHSQRLFNFYEDVTDFEQAWRLQDERAQGRHIPPKCDIPALLQYRHIGMLGEQVQRVLETFPREQIKLILYDDFRADTAGVYADTLAFLGLPPDNRTEFPAVNANKSYQSRWLHWMFRTKPWYFRAAKRLLRLGNAQRGHGMSVAVREMNAKEVQRAPLSPAFRQELVGVFREDIGLLGTLLQRDLSAWLS